jgi:hypothetical protein
VFDLGNLRGIEAFRGVADHEESSRRFLVYEMG